MLLSGKCSERPLELTNVKFPNSRRIQLGCCVTHRSFLCYLYWLTTELKDSCLSGFVCMTGSRPTACKVTGAGGGRV